MIDHELIKKYFVGRDGFTWWIGQVVSEKKWNENLGGRRYPTIDPVKGFSDRYKVAILGYHTNSEELSDDDLPWVPVMLPVTAGGGGGGATQSANIRQGTFVFGFFLDGEDAQQPIIIGIIGYNNYTAVSKGVPKLRYTPFDGYKPTDTIPDSHIRTDPNTSTASKATSSVPASSPAQAPTSAGVPAPPASPSASPNAPRSNSGLVIAGSETNNLREVSSLGNLEDGKQTAALQKSTKCGGNQMSGIQIAIQTAIQEVERLQNKLTSWAAAAQGKVNAIKAQIDRVIGDATKKVTMFMKDVVEGIRKFTVEKINNTVKDLYYLVFPNDRDRVKQASKKVLDKVGCIFNKVIGGLLGMMGNALKGMFNKVINVGACVVENFIGGMIGKVSGLISGLVDSVLGPINSIISGLSGLVGGALGAAGKALSLAGDILGFVKNLLGFLKCDEDTKCPQIDKWSIWNGTGGSIGASQLGGPFDAKRNEGAPGKENFIAVTNIFNKAKETASTVSNVSGSIGGAISDGEVAFNNLGATIKGINVKDVVDFAGAKKKCNVGPIPCGPPLLSIYGGGGRGATGNVIVNSLGEIMGVDIVQPGFGYISEPTAEIIDPCGKGVGVKTKVKLKKRKIRGPKRGANGIEPGSNPVGIASTTEFDNKKGKIIELRLIPGSNIEPGSDVTFEWESRSGTTLIYSNFGATSTTGRLNLTEVFKERSFIITVADNKEKVTAAIQLYVNPLDELFEIADNAIESITILEPGTGYLSKLDGSTGGDGRIWSSPQDTISLEPDGTYSRYQPGITTTFASGTIIRVPSETIGFNDEGDQIAEIPANSDFTVSTPVIITTPQLDETKLDRETSPDFQGVIAGDGIKKSDLFSEDNQFKFGSGSNILLGGVVPERFPTSSNKEYPILLYMCGVEVINGGVNYSEGDEIIIEPNAGAELKLKLGAFGSVESVEILQSGMGFKEFPEIYVSSQTGFNAKLVPRFCVNRLVNNADSIEDLENDLIGSKLKRESVIQVIDCVGKFNLR